jgi:hypothetical protein
MGVEVDTRRFVIDCWKRTLSLVAAIIEVVENVLVPDAIVFDARCIEMPKMHRIDRQKNTRLLRCSL